MPKLKEPSIKQKKFVREYVKTGNKTKAVLKSHDVNPKIASVYAQDVYKQKGTQEYLQKVLEEEGLTEEAIARDLRELKDKTKPKGKVDNAKLHLDTLKEINKLKDNYPVEKKQIEQKTANLNIDLTDKTEEDLEEMLTSLGQEIKQFRKMISKE